MQPVFTFQCIDHHRLFGTLVVSLCTKAMAESTLLLLGNRSTVAKVNSRHCATPPLVSPRNDVSEMSAENPC